MRDEVVLVSAKRTPIGKFGGAYAGTEILDLAGATINAAVDESGLAPDSVLLGNVVQAGNGQNPARLAAVRGGVPSTVPAITLNDVCLASMSAVGIAALQLRAAECEVALVGGFDSMSRAPHATRVRSAAKVGDGALTDLLVHDGLWCGIAETGMGPLSERENERLGIGRLEQDEFAAASHARAEAARVNGRLSAEIAPFGSLNEDEGIRTDSTAERLAKLRPSFVEDGTITAANASQMSDAAAAGVLTTRRRAQEAGIEAPIRIVDRAVVAGPDPALHGKPAAASELVLRRNGLVASAIDYWEINEAFAGVVLASTRMLGIGTERVNVNGGAIALGHPLGASGFRLVLTLAEQLRQTGARFGIAAICGGGGQGEAVLLSNANA